MKRKFAALMSVILLAGSLRDAAAGKKRRHSRSRKAGWILEIQGRPQQPPRRSCLLRM